MLKNLVKKFTSHSLSEDGTEVGSAPPLENSVAAAAAPGDAEESNEGQTKCPSPIGAHHHLRRPHQQPTAPVATRQAPKKAPGPPPPRRFHAPKLPFEPTSYRRSQPQAPSTVSGKSRCSVPSDPGKDDELNDSGTESDEELAIIETNSLKSVPVSLTSDYYTSQHSLSASCRSSHCSSPSLDQDCAGVLVSWDSFGDPAPACGGAGGNAGGGGGERGSAGSVQGDLEVELPHHHYHTRQQFKRFVRHQQRCDEAPPPFSPAEPHPHETPTGTEEEEDGENEGSAALDQQLASPAASCGSSADELESINGAPDPQPDPQPEVAELVVAFVEPAPRPHPPPARGRSSVVQQQHQQRSGSQGRLAQQAEKRKWAQVAAAAGPDAATTQEGGEAARRAQFAVPTNPSPRKKCRPASGAHPAASGASLAASSAAASDERHRPSLNFEKMREKLKNKASRRRHGRSGTTAMKSKLRGWSVGYQLRSSHSECLFQPLKFPPSPPQVAPGSGE